MTADAPCRFAPELADLAHRVVERYRAAGQRLITAESCTAGLIGACLAAAPQSTAVLHGAHVTYCSDLKTEALGVPADLIRERTPYDPEVARRMAQGALDRSPGVAVALSVTGVGGPDPDQGKPAGLVYIGLARRDGETVVEQHRFPGPPDAVLTATIRAALSMALAHGPGTGHRAGGSRGLAVGERAMTRGVIFDVDGTLVDSVDLHARAWVEALRHFGYEVEFEAVRSQIGKGGDQLMPVFVPPADLERRQDEIDRYRHDLFARDYMHKVTGFPGVRPLIERLLADGKRVALASSAKGDELERYKRVAGIDDLIRTGTNSDDVDRSKPHPDIFEAARAKLDLPAGDVVVVGDTPWDAVAAGKAGIPVIGVLCGGFAEADLRKAGCVEIYRDPRDLLDRYEGSVIGKPGP